MDVLEAKKDLAERTKRGLPIILAGLLFWVVASGAGFLLQEKQAVWVYLIGIGCTFPLGLMLAGMLKVDIFAKGNPLGVLGGIIGGMNVLNIPLVVFMYVQMPEWLPFTVAALVGAHFLPYVWIYDSKSFILLSVGTVAAASVCAFFFAGKGYVTTPIAVSVVYLLTVIGIIFENKNVEDIQKSKIV
ncbi:hypothetical protein [Bacillus manliponensis]|uniref:DUF7010 family protein n=1 Tax=Bacillus manliponensis TaxID=574376 RepID=UPI003511D2CC